MNIEEYREYCLSFKGVTESFPFDDKVLVFKVKGKMFTLTNVDLFEGVNVKCDPEKALELRADFIQIQPAFHMSKKHWNTIDISDFFLSNELIFGWIKDSYDLVVKGLTKKLQKELLEEGE